MSLVSPTTTKTYIINTGNEYIIDNSACLYPITNGLVNGVAIPPKEPKVTAYKTLPEQYTYEQLYKNTTLDGGFPYPYTFNSKNDVSFNNPHDLTTEYDVCCNIVPTYSYGRCMACNGTTLTSTGIQYATQQKIWGSVRVPSSVYTMNLGALNAYQHPKAKYGYVNWNQMSDRPQPSVQKVKIASSFEGSPSSSRTVTRDRPGAMSPGGVGCDIKHNSYERYLNRIKGKRPLRRSAIPSTFGNPINVPAWPTVFGNKTLKTGLVYACVCKPTYVN